MKPSGLPIMSATAQTDSGRRYSHPGPGLTHLEATAIQVIVAGRLVKILAAYRSPSRPLIGADLPACIDEGLPSWWPATSMPNTWIGTRSWKGDGGNSYVTTLARTPVWSVDRKPQPPTHTTPPLLPCLGHHDNQGPFFPGVPDFVLCIKLGPSPGTH